MDIDYIFPWVNPNDEYWRLQFYKYRRPDDRLGCRFRDFGLLQYVFRGIAKNMPWINKVHIILSQDSQVPLWLNTETVNVIYHKDYIPKEFLPTYNSHTIESYLGNIKGLSEHFIYGNDDVYLMGPSSPEDWFSEEGKPKIRYIESNKANSSFKQFCKKIFNDVAKSIGDQTNTEYYLRPSHYSTPLRLSSIREASVLLKDRIKNGTSMFRNFNINYNYYIFAAYMILKNQNEKVYDRDTFGKYLSMTTYDDVLEIAEFIKTKEAKVVCINDTEKTDISNIRLVVKAFQERFPEKCKYEK